MCVDFMQARGALESLMTKIEDQKALAEWFASSPSWTWNARGASVHEVASAATFCLRIWRKVSDDVHGEPTLGRLETKTQLRFEIGFGPTCTAHSL